MIRFEMKKLGINQHKVKKQIRYSSGAVDEEDPDQEDPLANSHRRS